MHDSDDVLFADEVIDELVAEAWRTFLDTPIDRIPEGQVGPSAVSASIAIVGERSITMVIACDTEVAWRSAGKVLMTEPDELTVEDVSDVLGELVNIVAGNLKGVYGSTSEHWTLSLPVVAAAEQTIHGSALRSHTAYTAEGAIIVCDLFEPA
ncbi:MAG: chemotaxis protein CheX [Ilumatobacteraceae bacterium]